MRKRAEEGGPEPPSGLPDSDPPDPGETLRYFLLGATVVWAFPGLFYVFSGRPLGAAVNAIGALLSLFVHWLFTTNRISYSAGVRAGLGVSLVGLLAESFLIGQADSQSAWYLVAIALAAGYLCGGVEIWVWAGLTAVCQVALRVVQSVYQPVPEYHIQGWELTQGQIILTLLCASFAFASRRQAVLRLKQVLKSEQYIREQSKLLETARDHAVAATQAKSRFLSTMSHEIRTPLYGILGAAQAIDVDQLEIQDYENVTTIVQSGELLLAVLNDILDSAKLDAGELSLHLRSFQLLENLEAACRLMRPLTERKGLQLELEINPDLPTHWFGDDMRVRQIVLNLLNNACKFSSQGTVTLRAYGSTGDLNILVSDQGVGISEADQAALFQPFKQLAEGDTRLHDGTGLGLWIVRRLAALMNGNVSLRSVPGEGSEFVVTLPLVATASSRSSVRPAEAPSARPLKVLVVDDNPVNRKVTLNLLKRLGHSAEAVEGGMEALALFKDEARYQVVLMDLQMPEMDGIQATAAIRALKVIRQPRIVAFSADVQAGKKLEIGPHAFDGFLGKPLRMQQLGECLDELQVFDLDPA